MKSFIAAIAVSVVCVLLVGAISAWLLVPRASSSFFDRSTVLARTSIADEPAAASPDQPSATSTDGIAEEEIDQTFLDDPYAHRLWNMRGDPRPKEGGTTVRVPVLMYHHVRAMKPSFRPADRRYTVTPESLEEQFTAIRDGGYTTISPNDLLRAIRDGAALPPKPVLLTFDDGFLEHYTIVYPLLQHFGFHATFFLTTGQGSLKGLMTKEMIQELDQSGVITLASHTRHHAALSGLSKAVRLSEIEGSKEDLERLLGHSVNVFAYPYGSWNSTIEREVAEAGYDLAFGVRLGSLHALSSRYQLRRIPILDSDNVLPILDRFLVGDAVQPTK